jgi:diguanylate cyclase (GGDEF)-like protein
VPKVDVVQVDSPQGWVGAFENRVFPFNDSQILAQFRDVSSEGRETRRLTWLSEHDQLTGGYNRRAMEALLDRALARAKDSGKKVGFIFIDIDFFKRINDDYGHDMGDRILIDFVERMTQLVGTDGELARIAGDEFAVILPEVTSAEGVEIVLKRIFDGLKKPFVFGALSVEVKCSAGAITVSGEASQSETMRLADRAMYLAKHQGRNQYVVA